MAQSREYTLDASGQWVEVKALDPGTDAAVIAEARVELASGNPTVAKEILTNWLERPGSLKSPYAAEGYLLRGDAKLAEGREESAIRDYEQVVTLFPSSEHFVTALEREFEIANTYLNGRRRKVLGVRIDSGVPVAEAIIYRIGLRLPNSRLLERAMLALGDFYFRDRDLKMAIQAYDVFTAMFPRSEYLSLAKQRRIYATIAMVKGPRYDASPYKDAIVLTREFAEQFPREAEEKGLSDALEVRLVESIAQQRLQTARFTMKRGDDVGARYILNRIVRDTPETAAAARALEILKDKGWAVSTPGTATTLETTPDDASGPRLLGPNTPRTMKDPNGPAPSVPDETPDETPDKTPDMTPDKGPEPTP